MQEINDLLINNSTDGKNGYNNKDSCNFISPKKINARADKILWIILKIKNSEEVSLLVQNLFGKDILDKLISSNIEDCLIDKVEKSILEIEEFKERGILII